MILFGYIDNDFVFFGRCYAIFCLIFSLTDVNIKVCVEDLIPHFDRCYCHMYVRW